MSLKKVIIVFLGIFFCLSCSTDLQKRHYRKGYYVARNKSKDHSVDNKRSVHNKEFNKLPSDKITLSNEDREEVAMTSEPVYSQPIQKKDEIKIIPPAKNTSRIISNLRSEIEPYHQANSIYSKPKSESSESSSSKADNLLYAIGSIVGLMTYGLIRKKRNEVFKLVRWAKKNKAKSRILIGISQATLASLGIIIGKQLSQLGYQTSDTLEYAFSGLMGLGFLSLLMRKQKSSFTLLDSFDLDRMSHLAIGLSFFALTTGIGNRLESHREQFSPIGKAVEVFHYNHSDEGLLQSPQSQKNDNGDSVALGFSIFFLILLCIAILLGALLLACSLSCQGNDAGAFAVVILGLFLIVLLIIQISKMVKRHREETGKLE